MYYVLAPDGYIQLIEFGPELVSESKLAVHTIFLDKFHKDKGMLWHYGVYLVDFLKIARFIDVKSKEVGINLGKLAGEEGILRQNVVIGAFKGMCDSVMKAGGFGWFASSEEFEEVMDEIAEEWDNIKGSCMAVRVYYGQKPV